MIELVQNGCPQVGFEPPLAGAGREILRRIIAEVRLEDSGGADGQEILIDDRIVTQRALRDQRFEVLPPAPAARPFSVGA